MTPTLDQSGQGALGRALDRLASLIATTDAVAITPDAIRVEYDSLNSEFAAFASADPEETDGVLVEISQGVAERVTVTMAGATVAMPDAPAPEVLTELALQWIILHEIGHWALGHIGLVSARVGLVPGTWRLAAVSQGVQTDDLRLQGGLCDLGPEEYRCLELQADFFATEVLDTIHQSGTPESCLSAVGASDPSSQGAARRRSVALAAGLCILLLERVRRDRGIAVAPRHPSPEARAFNVMQVIIGH